MCLSGEPVSAANTDLGGLPAEELQSLLQFMYVCPIGLIAFDDDGVIEQINPAAVNLLATSLGVMDFTNIYDSLVTWWPELRQFVRSQSDRVGPIVRDHRLRGDARASGGPRWVSLTVEKVAVGRNAMVVADVTATAEVEESLRVSEGRLRALFNSIDEGYCLCEMIVDQSGSPIDYRFVEANPLFEEMTGLTQPVGKTALELVPDLEFEWIAAYGRVALDGEILRFEQGSDAMGRWFDVFSMPVEPKGHFAVIFTDQTGRRAAVVELEIRRVRAELVAELLAELELQPTIDEQIETLVKLLVPRVADYASIEAPRQAAPLAIAHRDPAMLETLRELRTYHRIDVDDPRSVARAAAGVAQLISEVTPGLVAIYATGGRRTELLNQLAPRSHLAVQLDLGGGVVGTLMLGLSDPARPAYTDDDLGFFRETAQRVGLILAASRLRQEEHNISIRLQQALLPDSVAWHPNLPIEARYQAASVFMEVGGDWYDTFTWPTGHIGIVVGDVVGHNLDSAAAMGRLRAAAAALAMYIDPSPSALLEALDRWARGSNGTPFATAVCVVIEPATGRLTYSSAGHPPVLVIDPDGSVTRLDGAQGLPLCALASGPRTEATRALEPGALVVMYSDGLIERRTSSIENGLAQLEDLAGVVAGDPLSTIADRLIAGMTLRGEVEDDIVVVCCRYAPVVSTFQRGFGGTVDQLASIRSDTRSWLASHGLESDDVLIALGEACANAVEHAYRDDRTGEVDIELADHGYYLTACVRDLGSWQPPDRQKVHGGRGNHIMKSLSIHFARESGPQGTTVTMALPAVRLPIAPH
jgi:PAS domain-containing protein/anti-sigma regulatory factor (Ser/Thr protein kinase)